MTITKTKIKGPSKTTLIFTVCIVCNKLQSLNALNTLNFEAHA